MTIYNLRAFSIASLQFIYFTFSKTYFSILSINFYKTPHISLFILKYILFKWYKKIPFLFPYTPQTPATHRIPRRQSFTINPSHPTPAKYQNHDNHQKMQRIKYKSSTLTHISNTNLQPPQMQRINGNLTKVCR